MTTDHLLCLRERGRREVVAWVVYFSSRVEESASTHKLESTFFFSITFHRASLISLFLIL